MEEKLTPRSPEFLLLGLLSEHPAHGYKLHHLLQERFSEIWNISQSQTYNILQRLLESGDISAEMVRQEGLPDRRMLSLKNQGRKRFESWLSSPSSCSVRSIRMDFLSKLHFALASHPGAAASLIESQVRAVAGELDSLKNSTGRVSREQLINRIALELRIRHLQSTHEWLRELQTKISGEQK